MDLLGLRPPSAIGRPFTTGFYRVNLIPSPIKAKQRKTRGWEEDKTSGPRSVVSDAQ